MHCRFIGQVFKRNEVLRSDRKEVDRKASFVEKLQETDGLSFLVAVSWNKYFSSI